MSNLLTADNLPVILSILISAVGLNFLKEIIDAVRAWRRGASEKERNILSDTMTALQDCHDELAGVTDERDAWRQRTGRRDYLLTSHGIDPPNDVGPRETQGSG